ncbi:Glycosyltransferase [Quillaja saponaria]|uniref:Glycosyltransferase n=1 Tax=Quillaja saponaria TaxID=32244 RepID=A0AAD7L4R8_QUISA|nr:Glycosyltransferase [Quillaja saponaria]
MGKERKAHGAHCLVLSFPAQGHINPLLQFSKRLENKGVKVTFVTTRFITNSINKESSSSTINIEAISDGFDQGGMAAAESHEAYLERFWQVGPETLAQLLDKLDNSGNPVDCVVYDSFMPWALDIAKKFGLIGAVFLSQSNAVNNIYYHVHQGKLKLPLSNTQLLLPGLPPLAPHDMPTFLYAFGTNPAFRNVLVDQFSNIKRADWVLCNTFYDLEPEVTDWLMKILPAVRTIGPTIPSMFLDKQLEDDKCYGFSIFKTEKEACIKWLDDKPNGSVVYVSFGSVAVLDSEQMEEIAFGLRNSGSYFIWVVRASEEEKLPKDFLNASNEKGLVVTWSPQLQVLAHEAVGCFMTHCGWNSTIEALSLGVPAIAVPHMSDQSTNAKFIMDVWEMGIIASVDEKGIVRQQAIENCIRELLESDRGKEIKRNANKWKTLTLDALDEGGSSNKNTEEFVAKLVYSGSD